MRAGNLKGIGLKRQRNAGGGQRLRGLGGWTGGNRGQAEGVDGERFPGVGFSPNYSLTDAAEAQHTARAFGRLTGRTCGSVYHRQPAEI